MPPRPRTKGSPARPSQRSAAAGASSFESALDAVASAAGRDPALISRFSGASGSQCIRDSSSIAALCDEDDRRMSEWDRFKGLRDRHIVVTELRAAVTLVELAIVSEHLIAEEAVRLRKLHESGVKTMKDSIKHSGYDVAHPILVVPCGASGDREAHFRIVDGRHRLAAIRDLKLATVPCRIITRHLENDALLLLGQGENNLSGAVVPTSTADRLQVLRENLSGDQEMSSVRPFIQRLFPHIGVEQLNNILWVYSMCTPGTLDLLTEDVDENKFTFNSLYLHKGLMSGVIKKIVDSEQRKKMYEMYVKSLVAARERKASEGFSHTEALTGRESDRIADRWVIFDFLLRGGPEEDLQTPTRRSHRQRTSSEPAVDDHSLLHRLILGLPECLALAAKNRKPFATRAGILIHEVVDESQAEALHRLARSKLDERLEKIRGGLESHNPDRCQIGLTWLGDLVAHMLATQYNCRIVDPWAPPQPVKKAKSSGSAGGSASQGGSSSKEKAPKETNASASSSSVLSQSIFKTGEFASAFPVQDVRAVLGSSGIRMMWTDPPFNIRQEEHDHTSIEEVCSVFSSIPDELFDEKAVVFICCSWQMLQPLSEYWSSRGWFPSPKKLVWVSTYQKMKGRFGWVKALSPLNAHTDIFVASRCETTAVYSSLEASMDKMRFFDVIDRPFPGRGERLVRRGQDHKLVAWRAEQKPISLIQEFIWRYTTSGDWIIDPFAGTGSTLDAALRTGRNCLGCDRDESLFPVVMDRLQKVRNGLSKGEIVMEVLAVEFVPPQPSQKSEGSSTPSKKNRFMDEAQKAAGSDDEDEDEDEGEGEDEDEDEHEDEDVEDVEEDDESAGKPASDSERPRPQSKEDPRISRPSSSSAVGPSAHGHHSGDDSSPGEDDGGSSSSPSTADDGEFVDQPLSMAVIPSKSRKRSASSSREEPPKSRRVMLIPESPG